MTDDNRIRVGRFPRNCSHCAHSILPGVRYLSYTLGLKGRVAVCLFCAATKTYPKGGGLIYDCAAVREYISLSERP